MKLRNTVTAAVLMLALAASRQLSAAPDTTSGARLCFAKKSGVFVAAANGNGARRWLPGKGVANAQIAPDGKSVAFTLDKTPKESTGVLRSIAILDSPGARPRELTAIAGDNNYGPVWSPDGTRLLFQHFTGKAWHTAIVGRDGSGYRDVTASLPGSEDSLYSGWWAADSKSLYAYDFRSIYHVDLDGRELGRMPLAQVLGKAELASGYTFNLSPDGNQLLFDALMEVPDIEPQEGPPSLVFLHDFPTKTTRRVSPKDCEARNPAWLPDGKSFVFHGAFRKSRGIFRMDLSGGAARLLVRDAVDPSVSR